MYTALIDYEKVCDKVIRIKLFGLSINYKALYSRRQKFSKYYTFLWDSNIHKVNAKMEL
jgi:hypothetical protein